MKYNGSTALISGITQANNGDFPLVNGSAIQYKDEINSDGTYKSVSKKIEELMLKTNDMRYATEEDINNVVDDVFTIEYADLIDGGSFNRILRSYADYDHLILSSNPVPRDKIESSTIVSSEASKYKAYVYQDSDTLYVAPEKVGIVLRAHEKSPVMFGMLSVKSITFENFDTSKTNYMFGMFYENYYLEVINGLSKFNLNLTTNITSMFRFCYKLISLDLSEWNIPNLEEAAQVFYGCREIRFIYLPNWNTSKVKDLSRLFLECYNLTELVGVETIDTSSATEIFNMFARTNLAYIDISHFNTSNITGSGTMNSLFFECKNLITVNVSNLDLSKLEYLSSIFNGCEKLTTIIGLETWDISNLISLTDIFKSCFSITSLNISGWDMSNIKYTSGLFAKCINLKYLDLSKWNMHNLKEDASFMFVLCPNLTSSITISSPEIKDYYNIFTDCSTESGTQFIVNYKSGCLEMAKRLMETANGNVILGNLIS